MGYRRFSLGWERDRIAKVHPCIMFGPGKTLTSEFAIKNNITHVINCAFDEHCPSWFKNSNADKYLCLNAVDNVQSNILQWYPLFESTMDKYLKDPTSKTIYVHCQCGINRSGFLVLIYICKKFKYSFEIAVKTILSQRPCALTNPSYMEQSKRYIKTLV